MIASEYGYTIDQFGELTKRELDFMLTKMQARQSRAYAARAALHGVKLKTEPAKKEKHSDPAKAELASKLMKEALASRGKVVTRG